MNDPETITMTYSQHSELKRRYINEGCGKVMNYQYLAWIPAAIAFPIVLEEFGSQEAFFTVLIINVVSGLAATSLK